MNRSNLVTTRTGLTIGGHYVPPPPAQSRDADAIQAALLGDEASLFERALDWWNRNTVRMFIIMVGVGFLLAATRKLWA